MLKIITFNKELFTQRGGATEKLRRACEKYNISFSISGDMIRCEESDRGLDSGQNITKLVNYITDELKMVQYQDCFCELGRFITTSERRLRINLEAQGIFDDPFSYLTKFKPTFKVEIQD